jgi:hypothetical protein
MDQPLSVGMIVGNHVERWVIALRMSECAEGENQEGCKVIHMNAFPIPNAVTGPYINHTFLPCWNLSGTYPSGLSSRARSPWLTEYISVQSDPVITWLILPCSASGSALTPFTLVYEGLSARTAIKLPLTVYDANTNNLSSFTYYHYASAQDRKDRARTGPNRLARSKTAATGDPLRPNHTILLLLWLRRSPIKDKNRKPKDIYILYRISLYF